jgi:hypothetical protein
MFMVPAPAAVKTDSYLTSEEEGGGSSLNVTTRTAHGKRWRRVNSSTSDTTEARDVNELKTDPNGSLSKRSTLS